MSRNVAVVYSGQGAQFPGMGKDLPEHFPECRVLYERANAVLGYDLATLCFEGPEAELTRSDHCQPAIFVTSIACYTALKSVCPEFQPIATAGLSLGEWSALHMAGALQFEDTLKVLEARGRFMQEACETNPGGMLSVIGLSREQIDAVCEASGCYIANLNSPAQTVLSGSVESIASAETKAKELGAKRAIPLQVAGAFHSPLMEPASPRLAKVLSEVDIELPSIPVVANVTGLPHADPDAIRRDMIRQVTGSVHWYESVEWMVETGVDTIIECGPGNVLTGLIKRIVKDVDLYNIQGAEDVERVAAVLAD